MNQRRSLAQASVALARMVAESHNHGVPINLVRALGVRVISGWRPDDDLVYGSFLDQALRILAYKPKAFTPGQSAPILLYIHGGGWSLGDRFESGSNLRWFADRGSLARRSTTPCHPSIDTCGIPQRVRCMRDGLDCGQCSPARRRSRPQQGRPSAQGFAASTPFSLSQLRNSSGHNSVVVPGLPRPKPWPPR